MTLFNRRNTIQLRDLKWEVLLEGEYINNFFSGYKEDGSWLRKQLNRFSFSTQYILPNLEKYSFELLKEDELKNSNYYHKYNLLMHRPHVTPMQIRFEISDFDEYEVIDNNSETAFKISSSNHTVHLIARHKDNFLHIFPMLDFDCSVSGHHKIQLEERIYLASGHQKTNATGKVMMIMICNTLSSFNSGALMIIVLNFIS